MGRHWTNASLLLLLGVLALAHVRLRPPAPLPAEAPGAEFSAGRAWPKLEGLVGSGEPRPVGSAANAHARAFLVGELTALGLSTEVQEAYSCGRRFPDCARVRNVLARLPGERSGPAVLLMAHYDTVPASPGAGDDGAGVAALLEVARALRQGPAPRHPVLFLLSDGHEDGALGAKAFLERHPWAQEVQAVINLEARGTSGPSLMFETGQGNAWLLSRYAAAVPRPVTSSLFASIYRRLPNATDFTLLAERGVQGANLAFIGSPAHYHTPLDELARLSPASLQHHGENALALARAFAGELEGLPAAAGEDAVFFDVLGWHTVWWPERITPVLALMEVLLLGGCLWRLRRRGALSPRAWGWGLLGWGAGLVLAVLLGLGLGAALQGRQPAAPHVLPGVMAAWVLAFASSRAALGVVPEAGAWGRWAGGWTAWGLLAVVLAGVLPGASYLFLVPSLFAGLAGMWSTARPEASELRLPVAVLVPALVAAVLWFPLCLLLPSALQGASLPGVTAAVALVLATLAPLVSPATRRARWLVPAVAVGAAGVAVGVVRALPAHTAEAPQGVNLVFHQDADSGQARWLLRAPPGSPPASVPGQGFSEEQQAPFPWDSLRVQVAAAESPPVSAPTLRVLGDDVRQGRRHLRVRLASARGAPELTLMVAPEHELAAVHLQDQVLDPGKLRRWAHGWQGYSFRDVPPEGVELELVLARAGPVELAVVDRAPWLPPSFERVRQVRGSSAVPVFRGDGWMITRRLRL
jgi:hypothetical protein